MLAACMNTSVFISAIFHWNRFSPVIVYLYALQLFHSYNHRSLYILYSTDEAVLASTYCSWNCCCKFCSRVRYTTHACKLHGNYPQSSLVICTLHANLHLLLPKTLILDTWRRPSLWFLLWHYVFQAFHPLCCVWVFIVDMPMGIPPVVSSLNKSILTTSLTLKLYNQVWTLLQSRMECNSPDITQ